MHVNVLLSHSAVHLKPSQHYQSAMEESERVIIQSCPTLCDPMVCSPPGSSVHGESPARITGVPFPSPGDLPNPGIEPRSPALQAFSLPPEPPGKLC